VTHAAGARALAGRLLPSLDLVAESPPRRPWERPRALVELLGRALAGELGVEEPRWSEMREGGGWSRFNRHRADGNER